MAEFKRRKRSSSGAASSSASAAHGERLEVDPQKRVVAVTGAHGFIGSQVVRRLEGDRRYAKILAIDIRKPTLPLDKTAFFKIDLTLPAADGDLAAVLREERADTLVHCAFLGKPTHNATFAHELEDIGTMHVLNATAEVRLPRLVMLSTTMVYGPHPLNPNFLSEQHELKGHRESRFVSDKVAAERQVRRFRSEHPQTAATVLRLAPTVGPTIDNWVTHFLHRPVAPTLMGYDPLMQCLHESDAIDAFKLAIDAEHDVSGEFNIVGDGVLPYSTVLAMLGKLPLPLPSFVAKPLSRLLWATQVFDSPPSFLDFLRYMCVADGSKARQVLGFSPRYDIKRTLADFLGMLGTGIDGTGDLAGATGRMR